LFLRARATGKQIAGSNFPGRRRARQRQRLGNAGDIDKDQPMIFVDYCGWSSLKLTKFRTGSRIASWARWNDRRALIAGRI